MLTSTYLNFISKISKIIFFSVFSHLNDLINNLFPQLKRKEKDIEELEYDKRKKLLARYRTIFDTKFHYNFILIRNVLCLVIQMLLKVRMLAGRTKRIN